MSSATSRNKLALPLLGAALAICLAAPAFADCGTLNKSVQAAMEKGERQLYPELLRQALGDTTCDSDYRARLARVLALSSLKALAAETKSAGREPELAELEAVAALATPWQVSVSLGDAYYDRKDWPKAFQAYEAALNDMRDEKANPGAPPEAIERHAYQRAVQARALAPTFIASRQVRGAPSGLADPKFRNFTVTAVPIPVRFAYDSNVLEPDGEAAAQEIFAYLGSQSVKGVRLIGHTDPRGSDAYNLRLSAGRAEAVKVYLETKGYKGLVEIVPKGRSEPFQADDPGKYSEDELFAMSRRVEYQLIQ